MFIKRINMYFFLICLVANFFIAKRLRVCCKLSHNSKVILTKRKYEPSRLLLECKMCCGVSIVLILLTIISEFTNNAYLDIIQRHSQIFLITLLIWTGYFFLKKLTKSEISYLSSVNNLNLGYGAAIWYYKNYLDRILPNNFLNKVKEYEKIEGVDLPHKLYILCPKSCKVKQYIDNTDCIEFAKDLPPYEIDHGGIAGRKYSVSVYRIKYDGQFFRCGLEYAQPLKTLLALKENGKISASEMYVERESFIKHLALMLEDHKNSSKVCELVEYDDETEEIHEVLSVLPSVQKYKKKTVE